MKKVIVAIGFLITSNLVLAQNSFRMPDREFFTVSTSIDPTSSVKEKGVDFVGEIEYAGKIYAKMGFESFQALTGGYTDIHGAVGLNFTSGYFERMRYYVGARMGKVNRGGGFRINTGLEGGMDYDVTDNHDWFIGLRATLDKRHDQEIFGWTPETKFSGFVRIGYKWYYKNRRP